MLIKILPRCKCNVLIDALFGVPFDRTQQRGLPIARRNSNKGILILRKNLINSHCKHLDVCQRDASNKVI